MTARRHGRFIAVEGPTGVGKTTLVRRMRCHLEAATVFDPYEANPFLPELCRATTPAELARLGLLTELTFLGLRVSQLRQVAGMLAAGRRVLADYSMVKQAVFADLTLCDSDRDRVAAACMSWSADLSAPDLVIYLRADVTTLRERITARGREMESGITDAQLAALAAAYDAVMAAYDNPVLTVDAARFDVFNHRAIAGLARRVHVLLIDKEADCA